jgi:hypothetical protein
MKKTILKLGILGLSLIGAFFVNVSEVDAQTMTCTLVEGSITLTSDGYYCALYDCPNGETVQACNLPEVPVIGD